MAVLVKPNGLLGAAYMAVIRPFRYLIVYPQIMRAVRRKWRAGEISGAVAKPFVPPLAELAMLPRRQVTAQGYRPLGQQRSVVLSEWRRP